MISLYQALGVIGYCSLVSLIFWRGNEWFGKVPNYIGPLMVLSLLCTSAMICGLIVFAYPVKLYLKTKKYERSIEIVLQTAAWLAVLTFLIMFGILVLK